MNMVIGFGSTEVEVAKEIIRECVELSRSVGLEAAVQQVKGRHKADADRYKEMSQIEAPERYTYFWARTHRVYEGRHIVSFSMHHINRRHLFSPDGWALLKTEWVLSLEEGKEPQIYQHVA